MNKSADTISIIVANINDKITVLYDNESDRLSDILNEINESLGLNPPAYIKTVDKKKYMLSKDNAISLNDIIA